MTKKRNMDPKNRKYGPKKIRKYGSSLPLTNMVVRPKPFGQLHNKPPDHLDFRKTFFDKENHGKKRTKW